MRPIFTIHAGEYLVGTEIEKSYPALRVWIPTKDTGVDLLVTDAKQDRVASLQVKFSKDYVSTDSRSTSPLEVESVGWWTFNPKKIADSPADYWVLVLYQFQNRKFDFVVIPPLELFAIYRKISPSSDPIQSFISVTKSHQCWETRGLRKTEMQQVCAGRYQNQSRDLTPYLNTWPFASSGNG